HHRAWHADAVAQEVPGGGHRVARRDDLLEARTVVAGRVLGLGIGLERRLIDHELVDADACGSRTQGDRGARRPAPQRGAPADRVDQRGDVVDLVPDRDRPGVAAVAAPATVVVGHRAVLGERRGDLLELLELAVAHRPRDQNYGRAVAVAVVCDPGAVG